MVRKFCAQEAGAWDGFGTSIAVFEDLILIGDSRAFGGAGVAYLFDGRTGELIHTLDNPRGTGNGGLFGLAVAFLNGRPVVGAASDWTFGASAGAVYIFNPETGELVDSLFAPNARSGEFFGRALHVFDDQLLVGATRG